MCIFALVTSIFRYEKSFAPRFFIHSPVVFRLDGSRGHATVFQQHSVGGRVDRLQFCPRPTGNGMAGHRKRSLQLRRLPLLPPFRRPLALSLPRTQPCGTQKFALPGFRERAFPWPSTGENYCSAPPTACTNTMFDKKPSGQWPSVGRPFTRFCRLLTAF